MYRKTVLPNGAAIVTERVEHMRSVSLSIWVNAGSRDETERENGISHLIEHMIFKGTRTRDSLMIAKELDAIGGLSNAFTGKENTCFHARVLDKHFDRLADILADIFLNSRFDPEDLDRERQVILQEINMVEDTPDENIHTLFNRSFWRNHPIGMPILGTSDTVTAIDREAIFRYMERNYVPERILVVAAGLVDHEKTVSFFGPLFERMQPGSGAWERSSPRSHFGIQAHEKSLEQVHVCLGVSAPSMTDRDRFPCALFNTILGGNMSSRLFQEVRENRGLAYSVYSFLTAYTDVGVLGICMATDREKVNPALEVVNTVVQAIRKGEVTETDLEEAREHLIGGIYLSSESSDNLMMRLAKNEFAFGEYVSLEELVENLEKTSLDEVIDMARRVFHGDEVSLTTLGPFSEGDVDRQWLHFA
ncbi:MAG: insulinase family protein [Deltaproteobacteria bacterium]|nr:insulinase family protein [Deltaproteobacteria bacterium]